jgi:hypothetical protein
MLAMLAGCSSSKGSTATAPINPPRVTFVVIGGDEALSFVRRDQVAGSWPHLVFREALPVEAVYVNLAQAGFPVIGATVDLASSFAELQPDVVAIWAGAADAGAGRPVADFRAGLDELVGLATRKAGTSVLLATLPGGPDDYNEAIRDIAGERSLRLVELTGVVPADATELSAEQNRAIADVFIAAYRGP